MVKKFLRTILDEYPDIPPEQIGQMAKQYRENFSGASGSSQAGDEDTKNVSYRNKL